MKLWFTGLFTLILAACSAPLATDQPSFPTEPKPSPSIEIESALETAYPDLGPAPQIEGEVWLNTDGPLSSPELRGKVVLVDMWTFG